LIVQQSWRLRRRSRSSSSRQTKLDSMGSTPARLGAAHQHLGCPGACRDKQGMQNIGDTRRPCFTAPVVQWPDEQSHQLLIQSRIHALHTNTQYHLTLDLRAYSLARLPCMLHLHLGR
jgi:hypothetical protein